MKKLLCLILVVIMLVTAMPVAVAEGNTYKVGDIIQFGSYPQSEVKDEALIAELNALAPEWEDWTSYGYYSGDGEYGSMVQGDWMRYTDITYNDNKFRGVKFTQYRPYYTCGLSSSNTYQDDNRYSTNTVYWFKFEPIDWRVLDPTIGLVMCETIIDSQPFSNTIYYNSSVSTRYAYFNDSSYTNYASDYETSSIRQWLNNDFYNTAFTDSEKKEINTTTLNNDGYYTSVGNTGYEKLNSNSTNDKIFLLSYNEVINNDFGFDLSATAYDKARFAQGSDYAQSQGLYVLRSSGSTYNNNSYWLLRSPGFYSGNCCYVHSGGGSYNYDVDFNRFGVRPALRFNRMYGIINSEHTCLFSSVVTKQPTHLELGEITYTCECGDTYTESIPKLKEHTHTSKVTIEPTHFEEGLRTYICECNATYTEPIPKLAEHVYNTITIDSTCNEKGHKIYTCSCGDSYTETIEATGHSFSGSVCTNCGYDKADSCSCNCHKSGFEGFIWKILCFFYKLFRTNGTCSCGAAHY